MTNHTVWFRLTQEQTTEAVTAYAQQHGFSVSTVRTVTSLS